MTLLCKWETEALQNYLLGCIVVESKQRSSKPYFHETFYCAIKCKIGFTFHNRYLNKSAEQPWMYFFMHVEMRGDY